MRQFGQILLEQRVGSLCKETFSGGGVNRGVEVEQAAQDAIDISVQHSIWSIGREGCDGRGGIVSHPPQGAYRGVIGREVSAVFGDHLSSRSVQVSGTAIVSQSLPQLQHLILIGGSQRADGGVAFRKTEIVFHALHDARLLENDLRQPNAVRVVGFAPRQGAMILAIPRNQGVEIHGTERGGYSAVSSVSAVVSGAVFRCEK